MNEDYEVDEKKQAAANVLYSYSKFAMACIGNQTLASDTRLHSMKEISGFPSSLKRRDASRAAVQTGKSSSSATARHDKSGRFQGFMT